MILFPFWLMARNTEMTISNRQSRDMQINVRENRRANQEWEIQKNRQRWVQKTQDKIGHRIQYKDKQKHKLHQRKVKLWATRIPSINPGNPGSIERQAFPVSYNIPAMLPL